MLGPAPYFGEYFAAFIHSQAHAQFATTFFSGTPVDFDGDQLEEVIALTPSQGSHRVSIVHPNPQIAPYSQCLEFDDQQGHPRQAIHGDFNGDRSRDLLVSLTAQVAGGSGGFKLFLGTPNPISGRPSLRPAP